MPRNLNRRLSSKLSNDVFTYCLTFLDSNELNVIFRNRYKKRIKFFKRNYVSMNKPDLDPNVNILYELRDPTYIHYGKKYIYNKIPKRSFRRK